MLNFKKTSGDKIGIALLTFSFAMLSFCYGLVVFKYELFPYNLLVKADSILDPDYEINLTHPLGDVSKKLDLDKAFMGLNLASVVAADSGLAVQVIDMQGTIIHQWNLDWKHIWPNPVHLPPDKIPKKRPGTHIHGIALLKNGDLVFNYEHLGLVKVNLCGDVQWRLPYRTHHSIHKDEDGMLWVSAQKNHAEPVPEWPNFEPPFIEPMILKVNPDGEILKEISVFDLLKKNDMEGLLYITYESNYVTYMTGDTLHLNDVEPFPKNMEPGFFHPGDIMISLRNINTVLVFDIKTETIKFQSTGKFVRQHDPDFLDGNTISVFDNHTVSGSPKRKSRILKISAVGPETQVLFSGKDKNTFYTYIMGKSQRLPNGNLLISEPDKGRAFEVTDTGEIVWNYYNIIDETTLGLMEEVQRIPIEFQKIFNPDVLKNRCNTSEYNR